MILDQSLSLSSLSDNGSNWSKLRLEVEHYDDDSNHVAPPNLTDLLLTADDISLKQHSLPHNSKLHHHISPTMLNISNTQGAGAPSTSDASPFAMDNQ
jgi:hypothetical protein